MANIQKQFEDFHREILLDFEYTDLLREKRDRVVKRVRDALSRDGRPSFDVLLQGSYKMKTGVKPLPGMEYDIDVGLAFNINDADYDANTVRNWVHEAVKGHTTDVQNRGPCIRVAYVGDYHVDLVVYARWEQNGRQEHRLAHKKHGWRSAEPTELVEYVRVHAQSAFAGTDSNGIDQLRRVVRYLKRWDDERVPSESSRKPSGIAFTLYAINHLTPAIDPFTGKPDDLAALTRVATSAAAGSRLRAMKPTQEYEDVFAKLSDDHMRSLIASFASLRDACLKAQSLVDPRAACEVLKEHLGRDFPVPDAESTGRRTSAPAIITHSQSG